MNLTNKLYITMKWKFESNQDKTLTKSRKTIVKISKKNVISHEFFRFLEPSELSV
jgi:hypothetical protein